MSNISERNINKRPTDGLRGIFALLIVWHHLAPMYGIPYDFSFGNTVVLFFFVLSGFGITLSWKDRISGSAKRFMAERCVKIFPLQWLTVLLCLVFGISVVTMWAVPFHLTLTQSFVPKWQIFFSMNTPSWFLSSLFVCYLCTPLLLGFARRHRGLFAVLLALLTSCFVVFLLILPDTIGRTWLTYINPAARLLDYSAGMVLGLYWGEIKTWTQGKKGLSSALYTAAEIVLLGLMFLFMMWHPLIRLNDYMMPRYPVILGAVAIFSLAKGHVSQFLTNRWLLMLGKLSMSVYMFHGLILHFTSKVTVLPTWLNVVLSIVLIIVCAYFVEMLMARLSVPLRKAAFRIFRISVEPVK